MKLVVPTVEYPATDNLPGMSISVDEAPQPTLEPIVTVREAGWHGEGTFPRVSLADVNWVGEQGGVETIIG